MKRKLVVFEVLGLIFATFYQEKVGSTPDQEKSMQWKIAKQTMTSIFLNLIYLYPHGY
jgi:hypothetical protein